MHIRSTLVLAIILAACRPDGVQPSGERAQTTAPAPPPPPPCIHETCTDRPRWLRCDDGSVGNTPCRSFRIDYEHHCVCDAWGTVPAVDGGAR